DLAASLSGDNNTHVIASAVSSATAAEPARDTSVARSPAAGLIIESTFTTLADLAHEFSYPWVPVGILLTQKFDSMAKMARVKMPVLVVHGALDRYVPCRFSEALYAVAKGPKMLLLVDGASHNNSMFAGA